MSCEANSFRYYSPLKQHFRELGSTNGDYLDRKYDKLPCVTLSNVALPFAQAKMILVKETVLKGSNNHSFVASQSNFRAGTPIAILVT